MKNDRLNPQTSNTNTAPSDGMSRRSFLQYTAIAAAAASLGQLSPSAGARPTKSDPTSVPSHGYVRGQPRPNIIFIIDDQNPAGLTKRTGYPLDTMPTMDQLASHGVAFKHAYTAMPACMPSRTTINTGRWPNAHRVRTNFLAADAFFLSDIWDVARANGYRTAMVGKNHTYLNKSKVDFWREYTHTWGFIEETHEVKQKAFQRWIKSLNFELSTRPTPFPVEDQFCYRIVNQSIDFLKDVPKGTPFYMQVSFPQPHDPEQVPHPYWNMFPPDSVPKPSAGLSSLSKLGYRAQWLHKLEVTSFPDTNKLWARYISNYLGALRMIDDQVARLVNYLEGQGLLDNTIIVRTSDHGDYMMKYGLARKGVGLRETLVHVPLFWHGPGIHASKSVVDRSFVSLCDFMPTVCEFMGAEIPHGVQGRSMAPLITGGSVPGLEFRSAYSEAGLGGLYYTKADHIPVHTAMSDGGRGWDELDGVTQSGYQRLVVMGDWALIYDMMGYGQLYNLRKDPLELDNLFGKQAYLDKQHELMAELAMWTIRATDSLPTGPQTQKYHTKWPKVHNWYAPYREGGSGTALPVAFVP